MKVLYITNSGVGGANQSLLSSIVYLKTFGVVPKVVVPNKKTSLIFENVCETSVVKMRFRIWPVVQRPIDYLLFLPRLVVNSMQNVSAKKKIAKICSAFLPDIIHTNVGVLDVGYDVAKKMKIPHLWHIREYGYEDFGYVFFPSLSFHKKRLDDSYTISVTKALELHFHLLHNKAIYDGVYSETYQSEYRQKQDYFLFVGQLTKGKGVDFLIDTFIKFLGINKRFKLLLAGQGANDFVSELNVKVQQNHLEDRIMFLGQRNDVAKLMSEAKALIVPSPKEGLGRITIEAMFNNCLVVGYDSAGTKEQFDNGMEITNAEIAFRFSSEQELIDLLHKICCMDDTTIKLKTDRANEVVRQLYTLEKNSTCIYDYYKEIVKKG